jgi:hypothetical protein
MGQSLLYPIPLSTQSIISHIYNEQQHGPEECYFEYSNIDKDTAYAVIEELDENNEGRVHR